MMTTRGVETWKPIPGFSMYEASTEGRIRSVDRTVGGRRLKGRVLSPRISNRGYMLIDVVDDDNGKRQTRTVHTLILGTFAGPPGPGQQARHLDDNPLNNTWAPGETREDCIAAGGNLMWGTPKENNGDKIANGTRNPPPVLRVRECVRCEAPFVGNGRRCHACIVWIGEKAAELLSGGMTLGKACAELEYPSSDGLHLLAVKYGGYGMLPLPRRRAWLRSVIATLRDWLELGDDE